MKTDIKVTLIDEETKEKAMEMLDTPIKLKYVAIAMVIVALLSQNRTMKKFYRI